MLIHVLLIHAMYELPTIQNGIDGVDDVHDDNGEDSFLMVRYR